MARIQKLLMAMGGIFLVAASLLVGSLALTGTAALAQSAKAASTCPYSTSCGGISTSSSSAPPGGTITLSGHGYKPGSTVTISVCGIETITVTADSQGDFTTTITIPSSATPGTTCVITAVGTGANGQSLTSSVSVLVTSGVTVPVSPTGEPWSASLYWLLAAGTGLLGFGLFEIGRRRRFRSNT
ncbi:MAG: hypothetical protein ABSD78_03135 [Acidimicrobiales bacterium]